jgi:hypothetical protein
MRPRQTQLVDLIPPPQAVADRLGDAMREVELLRRLLRLSERAEQYRALDRQLRGEAPYEE